MTSKIVKASLSFLSMTVIFYVLWVGLRISDEGVYMMEHMPGDATFAACAGVLALLLPKWFERREELKTERTAA